MSCTNPLKAFTIGVNRETGKAKLKICSRDVTYLERDCHTWIKRYDDLPPDFTGGKDIICDYDLIPCGSCYSCRMTRAKDWTIRCMLESQYYDDNYFITLTYADHSLPSMVDCDTGEYTGKSSLVRSDFQKFFKRLRKSYIYDNNLRFLGSGEYGQLSGRCHFHACIFGLKLDDLKEYRKTDLGFTLFNSEFLQRCWSREVRPGESPDYLDGRGHPRKYLGFVVIAPLTYESAAYVARYCVKKQGDDNKEIYDDLLIQPEFLCVSLRPGLAYQYYEDHKDEIYKYDSIVLPEGKVVKPPKYFDRLYEREFPDRMAVIKANRKKIAEITTRNELEATDYDFDELLLVKDKVLRDRTKSLKRKEV